MHLSCLQNADIKLCRATDHGIYARRIIHLLFPVLLCCAEEQETKFLLLFETAVAMKL